MFHPCWNKRREGLAAQALPCSYFRNLKRPTKLGSGYYLLGPPLQTPAIQIILLPKPCPPPRVGAKISLSWCKSINGSCILGQVSTSKQSSFPAPLDGLLAPFPERPGIQVEKRITMSSQR